MQAEILVIPAARVIRVNPEGSSSSVAWWVIVVPILAAVIVITAVGVLLWVVNQSKKQYSYSLVQLSEISVSQSMVLYLSINFTQEYNVKLLIYITCNICSDTT